MSPRNRLLASISTALALGVRLAGHRRAAEQAGREGGRTARASGVPSRARILGVARQQLHLVVHAAELHHLRAAVAAVGPDHRAAEQARLADAAGDLGRTGRACRSRSGVSSIQTLSSFCQSVSGPSIFLASLITVAKGGGCPGARALARLAPEAGARRPARAAAACCDAAARRRSLRGGRAPGGGRRTAAPTRRRCNASRRQGTAQNQRATLAQRQTPRRPSPELSQGSTRPAGLAARNARIVDQGAPRRRRYRRRAPTPAVACGQWTTSSALKRSRCGLAPSSPRRLFLSASYSW